MFSSLRRTSTQVLRLRAARTIAPSTLTLLHAPKVASSQTVRSFAISRIMNSRNLPSIVDLSKHDPILEDAEHAVELVEDEVTRFQDLADKKIINETVIANITQGMKFDLMTKVQRKTILETVTGSDVLAQAKTGTGKTIAFLLPVLQRLLTNPEPLVKRAIDVRAIIISPTRELAIQIYNDAIKLTKGTDIICQSAVGGTGKKQSVDAMKRQGCHLLIATPGRLNDLLQDKYSGVTTSKVDTLVLDEGDTLLDQGFSEAVDEIIAQLPPANSNVRGGEGRQSLVFSATMPQKVQDMVRRTLRKDYKFLRMVESGETAVHTNVKQHLITCKGFENILPSVYELVMKSIVPHAIVPEPIATAEGESVEEVLEDIEHTLEETVDASEPFKAIVFFPTAKFATLAAATFRGLEPTTDGVRHPIYKDIRMFEIHSRLTQASRSKAAERFRNSKSAILFASDVVARGMDFPNVTHVIQVCSPSNQEQYIHRLGRTGRAGRSGVGYLLLTEGELAEKSVHHITKGMNMIRDPIIESSSVDMEIEQQLGKTTADALMTITKASIGLEDSHKSSAYVSLLGYFNGIVRDRQSLVTALNRWAAIGWGMKAPPSVSMKLAQQIGLTGISGLNHSYTPREGDDRSGGRGGFSSGGRGGGFSSGGRGGGFSSGGRGGGRGGFSSGGRGGYGQDAERRPRDPDSGEVPRSFTPRTGGDRPSYGGDRPSYGGDRPSYGGDRPSYGGDRGGRGGFGGGRGGGRGGFGGDRGGRPSYGERSERPSYGERSERPSYGERSERPSYGGDRGGRGSFGGGERRGGFAPRGRGGSSGPGKPWENRGGDRPSYGGDRGGFERREKPAYTAE